MGSLSLQRQLRFREAAVLGLPPLQADAEAGVGDGEAGGYHPLLQRADEAEDVRAARVRAPARTCPRGRRYGVERAAGERGKAESGD